MTDVELCAEAIRGHWSVENQLHWHLDANFNEDDNTTTDKNAFNNFSMLTKLSLTLLKLAQPLMGRKNISIRTMRKVFGWETESCISMILNTFDDEALLLALQNAKK